MAFCVGAQFLVKASRVGLCIVVFEAVFTFLFYAAFEAELDALWTVWLPWKRRDISWAPFCSHRDLHVF